MTLTLKLDSLARVMQAIFARGDVPHPELVKLRRRVIELSKAQKTTVQAEQRVSQAMIAFTFLTYIEAGFSPKAVRSFGMTKVLNDAKALAEALEVKSDGDIPLGTESDA